MATPSTDVAPEPEPRKSFRDRPLGRVALLLAVFLLAFIALRTCAARDENVSFEEAEAIAREQVDFVPEQVVVRGVQRGGVNPYLVWAVSLSTTNAAGIRVHCATVEVNATTGAAETQSC